MNARRPGLGAEGDRSHTLGCGTLGVGNRWKAADPDIEFAAGKTIGLLDISKPRGNIFLDRLEQRLTEQGVRVERYAKPTFTKPAPIDLRHEIATKCDLVIEALAD